ncbi:hypothetical protein KIN20_019688 [Parelaphostrongylus tenuis]|uniref:Uncharacterized protein n=1 Tax=Parelaphostrongylus tenuis TaxID=148309 RepID=A0AAD5QQB9_PARTN|nr:hypothetical protein KIN20_019688 [Parelaphostrongylus tenuis]
MTKQISTFTSQGVIIKIFDALRLCTRGVCELITAQIVPTVSFSREWIGGTYLLNAIPKRLLGHFDSQKNRSIRSALE